MTHRFPQLHHLVFEEEVIDGSDPFFAVMATSKMSDHAGRARIFELQDRTADLALRLRSVITNVEEEPRNRPLQMRARHVGCFTRQFINCELEQVLRNEHNNNTSIERKINTIKITAQNKPLFYIVILKLLEAGV